MTGEELEKWSAVDITAAPREDLAELRNIHLDAFSPIGERLDRYLEQTGNPYCFLWDGTPVKLSFSEEEHSLRERLTQYFLSRRGS